MSQATSVSDNTATSGASNLRTNSVDQVASMMLAMSILIGAAVSLLVVIYLTSAESKAPETIRLEEERPAGRGDHAAGFARDLEPPGAEDVQELREPTLEQSLQAVTSAVSSVSASFDSIESGLNASSFGKGQGDSRPPGPLGEGDDIIPRYERWDLKFTAKNILAYATQLDYFKIELGAIGGGPGVDYAANVSGNPTRRNGKSETDKRLYFMWRQPGPLQQFDRQLLGKASITTNGRLILKFVSSDLENQLAVLEIQYAKDKLRRDVKAKEIAKTVFEARAKDKVGYEWVVIDQRYRNITR